MDVVNATYTPRPTPSPRAPSLLGLVKKVTAQNEELTNANEVLKGENLKLKRRIEDLERERREAKECLSPKSYGVSEIHLLEYLEDTHSLGCPWFRAKDVADRYGYAAIHVAYALGKLVERGLVRRVRFKPINTFVYASSLASDLSRDEYVRMFGYRPVDGNAHSNNRERIKKLLEDAVSSENPWFYVNAIASRLGLLASSTSAALSKMHKHGLVKRVKHDRKYIYAALGAPELASKTKKAKPSPEPARPPKCVDEEALGLLAYLSKDARSLGDIASDAGLDSDLTFAFLANLEKYGFAQCDIRDFGWRSTGKEVV